MSGSNAKQFKLSLTNAYMLNDRTRHLEFKLLTNEPLSYVPGQFISLLIEKNSEIIRRNFSIACPPSNSNKLEIAATFVPNGIASTTLWSMEIEDQINASGPYGIFILKPEELVGITRCILVATGTGVTPYRAMLPSIREILKQSQIDVILLFGVRNFNELLYAEDFINFAKEQPNFKFIACYSRGASNITRPTRELNESFGYVQNKLTELNINHKNDLVYLCGNPNMIDEALVILESLNMPRNKIKREKYISAK